MLGGCSITGKNPEGSPPWLEVGSSVVGPLVRGHLGQVASVEFDRAGADLQVDPVRRDLVAEPLGQPQEG